MTEIAGDDPDSSSLAPNPKRFLLWVSHFCPVSMISPKTHISLTNSGNNTSLVARVTKKTLNSATLTFYIRIANPNCVSGLSISDKFKSLNEK